MSDEIIPPEKVPPTNTQSIGKLGSILAAAGVALLTVTFVGSFLIAIVWSFGMLLGVPDWVTYPFYAAAIFCTGWATLWAMGRAWHVEKRLAVHQDIDQPVFEALHYFRKSGSR